MPLHRLAVARHAVFTSPKATFLPSSQGAGSVSITKLELLESGPVFAIVIIPGGHIEIVENNDTVVQLLFTEKVPSNCKIVTLLRENMKQNM